MTMDEMTDEELDEFLAEFLGWELFDNTDPHAFGYWKHPEEGAKRLEGDWNPTQSLDDMRIVEEKLEERGLREDYIRELADMELADRNIAKFMEHMTDLITASPSDRARAAAEVIPDEEGDEG